LSDLLLPLALAKEDAVVKQGSHHVACVAAQVRPATPAVPVSLPQAGVSFVPEASWWV